MKRKVKDCKDYRAEFPELFPWSLVDSISLSKLSQDIADRIKADFRNGDIHWVPGLRRALNMIAEMADIWDEEA